MFRKVSQLLLDVQAVKAARVKDEKLKIPEESLPRLSAM